MRDNSGLILEFTVKNIGDRPLVFLKRGTPFEGPLSNLFVVRDADGKSVWFQGAYASRVPVSSIDPEKESITLLPKASIKIDVDIANQYEFLHDGTYFIRVRNPQDGSIAYHNVMDTYISVEVVGTAAQRNVVQQEEALRMTQKQERLSLLQTRTERHHDLTREHLQVKASFNPSTLDSLDWILILSLYFRTNLAVCHGK